ncbi:MAG: futalosine hydrolase [Dissulfurimicrobium sp.]|uniref:futalosine hydrolase n=1 Tax=Dissulfurimicrobium sp. TaxID=2022436 RepID=UPI00404B9D78
MNLKKVIIAAPTRLELNALFLHTELSDLMARHNLHGVISGVGPGATAMNLTMLMERERPEIIIMAGIGGGYEGAGVRMKEVFFAESEAYGDLGRCAYKEIEPIKIDKEALATVFPLKDRHMRFLKPDFFKIIEELGIKSAPMVTVSCLSGDFERAERLRLRFGAAVENMEGAAAAQVCDHYDIPLIELRGISNMAGDTDKSRWMMEDALQDTASAIVCVLNYLKNLSSSD